MFTLTPMERKEFTKRIVVIEVFRFLTSLFYYTGLPQFRSSLVDFTTGTPSALPGFMGGIAIFSCILGILEFKYILCRAKDIGTPTFCAMLIAFLASFFLLVKIVLLLSLCMMKSNRKDTPVAVPSSCPNFKPIAPLDNTTAPIALQPEESPAPQEGENFKMIRELKRRTIIFISFNVVGIVIILYGLLTKYTPALVSGIVISVIGINFSILVLPALILLVLSILISAFVTPHLFPVAIAIALIAAWTAYSLYTEHKQLKDGILPF